MKIGSGLALICVGAILAFAVTANTSVFNIHTAGWVLMLVGLIGLLLPRSTAGWLGRRLLVRRTYRGGRVGQVPVRSYVANNPGTRPLRAGLPSPSSLIDQDRPVDLIDEGEDPRYDPAAGQPQSEAPGTPGAATEVIEDLYEQP